MDAPEEPHLESEVVGRADGTTRQHGIAAGRCRAGHLTITEWQGNRSRRRCRTSEAIVRRGRFRGDAYMPYVAIAVASFVAAGCQKQSRARCALSAQGRCGWRAWVQAPVDTGAGVRCRDSRAVRSLASQISVCVARSVRDQARPASDARDPGCPGWRLGPTILFGRPPCRGQGGREVSAGFVMVLVATIWSPLPAGGCEPPLSGWAQAWPGVVDLSAGGRRGERGHRPAARRGVGAARCRVGRLPGGVVKGGLLVDSVSGRAPLCGT